MTTFYNRELYRARRTLAELPERSRHWADPAVERAVLSGSLVTYRAEYEARHPEPWWRRLIGRLMR